MANAPDWWNALSPYLDEALERVGDARRQWLAELRGTDPGIAAELEPLLAHHDALVKERFLENGPELPMAGSLAGTTVGAYTLDAPLGDGGMGTVWLATRDDGEIRHRAAVKFLGPTRPGWHARFLRERQFLASLNHPAIVRVIDAGRGADGRPYLVMEYVDGRPIDEYAATLSVRQRLELFLRACEAVAHAHRRLLIHRDLKPSNILVDAEGQPKLLDFGIAKLLDDTGTVTEPGERLMTPQYASPEQIAGAPQTTATDIYSLGAVLYRMLTGRAPRDTGPGGTATGRQEPPQASTTNPEIPRDLDYVLRKALRQEPAERYGSVDALAGDVRAVLAGRPVEARAGDRWYRTRTFTRRNRVAVTAAALIVLSLVSGLVVANRQRRLAEERFQQVRQIARQFIALDDDLRDLPGTIQARNRIVTESLQYLQSLGQRAAGDADLALEIGAAYLQVARVQGVPYLPSLGRFADAQKTLAQADVFIDAVLARRPTNRQALLTSAQIAHDRMTVLDNEDRREEALAQARRAATQVDRLFDADPTTPDDVNAATQILSNVAIAYQNSNQFDESIRFSRRAVDVSAGVEAARMRRASAFGVLSVSLRRIGDLEGALAASRQSRQLLDRPVSAGGADRYNLINALLREGLVLGEVGGPNLNRPDEALAAFRRAFTLAEEMAIGDPKDFRSRERVSQAAYEIGRLLSGTEPAEALRVFDHALQRIREATPNARTRRIESDLLSASSFPLRMLGREPAARRRLDAAFEILATTTQYPADAIEPLSEPSNALEALAAHHEAAGAHQRALEIVQELTGKIERWGAQPETDLRDAVVVADLWMRQARLFRLLQRPTDAEAAEIRARDLWIDWNRRQPTTSFIQRRLNDR